MLRLVLIFTLLLTPAILSARWIQDIVIIENEDIGAIEFSHSLHLEALGRDCVLCHNDLFHIDPAKNTPVSMSEMEKGKSCGACHNGQKAFTVEENCDSCHP